MLDQSPHEPEQEPTLNGKSISVLRVEIRRRRRWNNRLLALIFLLPVGMMMLQGIFAWDIGILALLSFICLPVLMLIGSVFSNWLFRRRLIRDALKLPGTSGIGPILLLQADSHCSSEQGYCALCELLPRLESSTQLTIEEREALALLIKTQTGSGNFTRGKIRFTLVALRTVGRLQDSVSLPAVRHLAAFSMTRKLYTMLQVGDIHDLSQNPEIRNLARAILPALEKSVEKDAQFATLLRASSGVVPSDELLRAAAPTGIVHAPDELLRAAPQEIINQNGSST